jgi:hypothetical protein
MEKNDLFKNENCMFYSAHEVKGRTERVIGSLYFLGKDNGGNVFRGRIRLVHCHGPKIENSLVKKWELHEGDTLVDLTGGMPFNPMIGKRISEKCSNGSKSWTHISRGVLMEKDDSHQLSNEQLSGIINVITNTATDANRVLREHINTSLPEWIHQPEML